MHIGHTQLITTIVAVVMALLVIAVRLKASQKPTNTMKIIMPSLGMSTGFIMFLFPVMRIPWLWALFAFLAGAILFAYPLILTSKFHVVEGKVYLKRSPSFIFILFGLLAVRLLLHQYIEQYISIPQTGAVFFILAFGMLLPWRLAMYREYRSLLNGIDGFEQKT